MVEEEEEEDEEEVRLVQHTTPHEDFGYTSPLCSSSVLIYVHRDRTDFKRREAQDGRLDFYAAH